MGWFDLLVGAGLVYRLSRLVVDDAILDRPRNWVHDRGGPVSTLVGCYWCASVWLAAGALAWWWVHAPSWRAAAIVATWSAAVGWAAEH